MKSLSKIQIVAGLASLFASVGISRVGLLAQPPAPPLDRTAWVEQCLKDFESIKPGMTRGEAERKLLMDGGLQSASPVRFVHPECRYFKIEVQFDFARDPADQN